MNMIRLYSYVVGNRFSSFIIFFLTALLVCCVSDRNWLYQAEDLNVSVEKLLRSFSRPLPPFVPCIPR